jgi:amino acid transporter
MKSDSSDKDREKQPAPSRVEVEESDDHPLHEMVRGSKPGQRYVRVVRPEHRVFKRVAPDHLEARDRAHQAQSPSGRFLQLVRRLLIGRPLATGQYETERLSKVKALAVLASDVISSSAYATEEIIRVLVVAGAAAISLTLPIAIAIALLLAVVATSYMQTIKAYPEGGGSYTVTRDNLGVWPSLVAGSALMIDYVLTVAVSVSAGVAALTSAIPDLRWRAEEIGIFFIFLITLANIRGVRHNRWVFAAPTYLFVAMVLVMIGIGWYRVSTGDFSPATQVEPLPTGTVEGLSIFLLLKAFASGNAALTGLEAISDGVSSFEKPESKNARITLAWMSIVLASLFLGISYLAVHFVVLPTDSETVISQLGRISFGNGSPFYYLFQASTMMILVLAANTAFLDFPRLCYFLARDRFMPSLFQYRGERLAYTAGILMLAAVASLLVLTFNAQTHALIPLYAVGVFLSFTLSQTGMVMRWWRNQEPGWRMSLPINAFGAICTGVVTIIVAMEKFVAGAWMVILLIVVLTVLLRAINRHYVSVADELAIDDLTQSQPRQLAEPIVLVPVPNLNRASIRTLEVAHSISSDVTALFVTDDLSTAEALRKRWAQWGSGDTPLVVLESPYRSLITPILAYVDAQRAQHPRRTIMVMLGEFVPRHWWEWLLHGQSALRLKAALFFRPNVVVADVAYHLTR